MKCYIPDKDLSQRLNETVVVYDKFPYRCRYAGANSLELVSLRNGKPMRLIHSNDDLLDVSTPPMGNVQVTPTAVAYVTRRPLRMYKQGLSNDSIRIKYLNPSVPQKFTIFSPPFEDMILGRYPSLDDAFKLLRIDSGENINTEIAVSREIALRYEKKMELTHVYFKGDRVGYIVKDSRTVITPTTEAAWVISRYLSQLDWKVE